MAVQGVIYVINNVTLHIKNTTIQNNHAKKTVIVQGKNHTSIHLERSLLEENFGDGTILVEDNSSLQFSYCQVRNNVATSYVLSTVKSTLSMTHSTFSDNLQASVFQGISSEINIDWCTFTNNSAMTLGAVGRIQYPSKVRVYHSTFIQNHANEKGGALVSYGDSLELYHSTFIENVAGSKGGAIYLSIDKTKFKAVNVSFIRNRAGMDGAAVHIHANVDTIFDRCTFLNNSAPEGTSLLVATNIIRIANSKLSNGPPQPKSTLGVFGEPLFSIRLLTYKSTFLFNNSRIDTSEQNFLGEMLNYGLITNPEHVNLTQRETAFASGNNLLGKL